MYKLIRYWYLTKFLLVKKSFKYFIGYKDEGKIKPLCLMLSKVSGYTKNFNETKYFFLITKMMNCSKNMIKS